MGNAATQVLAPTARRQPIGAEVGKDGTHFRVWAPRSRKVSVKLGESSELARDGGTFELLAEADGYFSALVGEAKTGWHYKFQLDHGTFPDPASRFQPDGPHAASRLVDPGAYSWSDAGWRATAMETASFTKCTWAPSRLKAPGVRPRSNCRSLPTSAPRRWR
ncbi:MAG: hypothetical protein WDN28_25290 [Chthoniobacter sp.]